MAKNIIFAGGGTGGHIYPALTIAKAVQKNHPDIQIHFIGTKRGLEKDLVPKENFPLHFIPIGRLNKNVSLLERITTVLQLPFAFLKSLYLLIKLRPRAILGVGGYASAPILFAGSLFEVKTFIWEPNAYPGLANRLLSKYVDESLVVFEAANKFLKTKKQSLVGMPIRESIENLQINSSTSSEKFRILVFCGSQGASSVNQIIVNSVTQNPEFWQSIELIHQTGSKDFENISSQYKAHGCSVKALSYINDMEKKYQWADLVMARAGTGTIYELAACGKASILIPLPNASDNHQYKNAKELVDKEAAVLIEQKKFNPESLVNMIESLKSKPEKIKTLSENIKTFHQPRAAQVIAQKLIEVT